MEDMNTESFLDAFKLIKRLLIEKLEQVEANLEKSITASNTTLIEGSPDKKRSKNIGRRRYLAALALETNLSNLNLVEKTQIAVI